MTVNVDTGKIDPEPVTNKGYNCTGCDSFYSNIGCKNCFWCCKKL